MNLTKKQSFPNLKKKRKNYNYNKELKKELKKLKKIQNKITTSDLQGMIMFLSKKFKVNEDDLLEEIYSK